MIKWSKEKHKSNWSFQEEVVRSLYTYDSELVIELLDNINSHCTNIPCFRNGSTIHGIFEALNIFGSTYSLFKQTISHVKIHYKDKLINDITKILSSNDSDNELLRGTFILAGYLGFEELEEILKNSIQLFKNNEDDMDAILFATFRCINKDMDFIDGILDKWNRIVKKYDDKYEFDNLKFSFRDYPITNNILNYLCINYQKFANIKNILFEICCELDNPTSFQFVLNYISNEDIFFDFYLFNFRKTRISIESRTFLENYFQNENMSDYSRNIALKLWAINCNHEDILKLHSINDDSCLFLNAIDTRIEFGDFTALDLFIENFENWYVLNKIHNVWNNQAKKFVEKCFEDISDENREFQDGLEHLNLVKCLAKIPLKDAEYYIKTNWEKIKYFRVFIQLNFYLCTDLTIKLNNDLFNEIKPNKSMFESFTLHFLYMEDFDKFSTERHFNEILEYLIYFDYRITYIFRKAEELGFCEWIKKACQYLNEDQYCEYCKTDEGIIHDMELEKDYFYWPINPKDRCFDKNRINKILKLYLKNNLNVESFNNVAMYIKENGNRDDLEILHEFKITGTEEIIKNVEFSVKCRTLS